tara:strand:+ start:95 stop:772 length:678 start_codon:yes stop_codon:yes gene_type:complete
MIFTPQAVMQEVLKTNFENEAGVRLYNVIDPISCFRTNTFDFILTIILEFVSPTSIRVDFDWRSVCLAISQLYEDGVALSEGWKELEGYIADHSYKLSLDGDQSFLKERLKIANLPISQNERNYYPHRDKGRLLRKRGRKSNGRGRYLFARLWLEIVEAEKAKVANHLMKQHFDVTDRHINFGIARGRGGIEEILMKQLIEECARSENLREYVRGKFRNEYIGLF